MKNIILLVVFLSLGYFLYQTNQYENTSLKKENCELRYSKTINAEHTEDLVHVIPKFYPEKQFLDLSNKKLHSLPETYFKRSSCIEKLTLNNNQFKKIPLAIQDLTNIQVLDMSYCLLSNEHNKFFSFPKGLQKLNLSENQYKQFNISKFNRLKQLDLVHNDISSITISAGTTILGINLNNNRLRAFPSIFHKINGLKKLELRLNEIDYLDFKTVNQEDKNQFKDLQILNLSKNSLKSLPKSFSIMPKLKTLDLENNKITGDVFLFDIDALETFNLQNQNISSFTITEETGRRLKSLNLSNNDLRSFDIKGRQFALTKLLIKNNSLREIPSSLHNLQGLKEVSLKNNFIEVLNFDEFPPQIKTLDLTNNNITTIVGKSPLTLLTSLTLDDNPNLKEIPLEILKKLTYLEYLSITNNKLTPNNFAEILTYCTENDISFDYFNYTRE